MIEDKQLIKFYMKLTERKKEVVELISQGYSNNAVADRLCITAGSVAGHLTEIYGGLSSYEELEHLKANRQLLTSLFAPFFDRHPDMKNDDLPGATLV